jgi:hypothetical protein
MVRPAQMGLTTVRAALESTYKKNVSTARVLREQCILGLTGPRHFQFVGQPEVILGRYLLAGEVEICGEFPDHAQNTTSQIVQVRRSPAYRNVG